MDQELWSTPALRTPVVMNDHTGLNAADRRSTARLISQHRLNLVRFRPGAHLVGTVSGVTHTKMYIPLSAPALTGVRETGTPHHTSRERPHDRLA